MSSYSSLGSQGSDESAAEDTDSVKGTEGNKYIDITREGTIFSQGSAQLLLLLLNTGFRTTERKPMEQLYARNAHFTHGSYLDPPPPSDVVLNCHDEH